MDILDAYIKTAPSDQNVLDLFDNEWSSHVPGEGRVSRPGTAFLFEDARISWLMEVLGGVSGLNVLELGPLEAGHSTMLEQAGVGSVLAIEANTRAFMKCLCIKELLQLQRTRFLLGDFVKYLENTQERFDLVLASGVLYHMMDPARLLALIGKSADRVMLWTHYFEESAIRSNRNLTRKFGKPRVEVRDGVKLTMVDQAYLDSLGWSGFCGGAEVGSVWLTRESILDYLRSMGFNRIDISFDAPNHQNGPSFAVCARRN
jgi:hypothetical protein